MNIVITRTLIKGEYAHGHLTIDGLRICETLENSTALVPAGNYALRLTKCKQYARKLHLLANLEPRTLHLEPCCDRCKKLRFVYSNTVLPCYCPMLKPGNGVHNRLDGSILVGRYNGLGCLVHPKEVLEPLRRFVGAPIVITSGYRSNQLNIKVGGAYASQHTLGEAADIRLPLTSYTTWDDNQRHTDMETARRWFDWLERNTDFDQLILETANGKDFWIHVSCRRNRRANRHQVIRYLKK